MRDYDCRMRTGICISTQILIVYAKQKFLTRPGLRCSRASLCKFAQVMWLASDRVYVPVDSPEAMELVGR